MQYSNNSSKSVQSLARCSRIARPVCCRARKFIAFEFASVTAILSSTMFILSIIIITADSIPVAVLNSFTVSIVFYVVFYDAPLLSSIFFRMSNLTRYRSYHHGEVSLQGAITNMACDYVGSNNLNLLNPNGQFGTRLMGGKDCSAARYIFTELNRVTGTIFNSDDLPLLNYLDDDGFKIEPEFYVPVVPMILINGANGIGTGFSTQVPCYNPVDIVANLHRLLNDEEPADMLPFYRGFTGGIEQTSERAFATKGIWHAVPGGIEVTELPIGSWTDVYKEFLEASIIDSAEKDPKKSRKQFIQSYENRSTESTVRFVVKIATDRLQKILAKPGQIEADLRLTSSISTNNMHLFNEFGVIQKYAPVEILRSFYNVRLDFYGRRKTFMLKKLKREVDINENKVRFIEAVMDGSLIVFRRPKDAIVAALRAADFMIVDSAADLTTDMPDIAGDYQYLIGLPIGTFTEERIASLMSARAARASELSACLALSEKCMWRKDLEEFSEQYAKLAEEYAQKAAGEQASGPSRSGTARRKRKAAA